MKSEAIKTYRVLLSLIVLILLFSAGLITYGWYYLVGISMQTNQLLAEEQNATNENQALQNLALRYRRVQSEKDLVAAAVPDNKDMSTFITSIEDLAKQNNLLIEKNVVGNSQVKSKASDSSQTISKKGYNELQIQYTVTGSYTKFTNFLGEMGNLRRLNNLYDLNITLDEAKVKALPDAIRANFSISIYMKK